LEDRVLPATVAPLSPLPPGIAAVFTGDFNGDGKTDLVQFTKDGRWLVSLNTSTPGGATTFTIPAIAASWSPASMWRQLFVGDFNGDGKTDVAGLSVSGAWFVGLSSFVSGVPTFGQNQFITGAPWAYYGTGSNAVWTKLFVADFNGDGKDDIAGFGFNGKWFVGLSQASPSSTNQSDFSVGAPWADFGTGDPHVWLNTYIGDFNGDGKADILGLSFLKDLWVGLSNGTDNFSVSFPWYSPLPATNTLASPVDPGATTTLMGDSNVLTSAITGPRIHLYLGDFNGDGKTDIAIPFVDQGQLWVGLSTGIPPARPRVDNTNGFDFGSWIKDTLLGPGGTFLDDIVTGLFVGSVSGGVNATRRDDIIDFATSGQWLVALSQAGPGGSNSFQLSNPPFADYGHPSSWVALAVGSNPTNNNPTEELAHPAEYSTEFNSPTGTMDGQTDIAALGFNLSWFIGISSPAAIPKQFATGGVAVQW
jgi:hypothetical protein